MTAVIEKWGNSLAVRIPQAIAEQMQIQSGS
jgi:antitoxin MazE